MRPLFVFTHFFVGWTQKWTTPLGEPLLDPHDETMNLDFSITQALWFEQIFWLVLIQEIRLSQVPVNYTLPEVKHTQSYIVEPPRHHGHRSLSGLDPLPEK